MSRLTHLASNTMDNLQVRLSYAMNQMVLWDATMKVIYLRPIWFFFMTMDSV